VPRVVPAIVRAFSILELFLKEDSSLSVPEIVARLGLPRTSTHEIVNTLVEIGYLRRDEYRPNKVHLGHKVLELGDAYGTNFDLAAEGHRVAEKVMAKCDETVQMAVLEGTEAVFIAKVDSPKAVRLVSRVGSRLPAHCTAVGKMLLSSFSDDEIIRLYNGEDNLTKMTLNSIPTVSKLLKELEPIRQRGLSYDDCESNTDVQCVAAPVYGHDGRVVAAMSISVPATRMTMNRQYELAEIIRKGSEDLSKSMGHKRV
jgi:IclR family KDG regulon transcriptional repressor